MPTFRTFGTWLRAYAGDGPIGDLRDDFLSDCRRRNILVSSIKTGAEMDALMRKTCWEWGCRRIPLEGYKALEEACILYGDPWRRERDEHDY